MKQIKGKISIAGIKRCYVEGAIIKTKCPNCGNKLETDLSENYLSYPEIGKKTTIWLYCENCDEKGICDPEHAVSATVKSAEIVIEYNETKISSIGLKNT